MLVNNKNSWIIQLLTHHYPVIFGFSMSHPALLGYPKMMTPSQSRWHAPGIPPALIPLASAIFSWASGWPELSGAVQNAYCNDEYIYIYIICDIIYDYTGGIVMMIDYITVYDYNM